MSVFSATVSAKFHFEAAHYMPNFPEGHPNRRLHGHSYIVEITVRGPVSPVSGVVMDHGDLEKAVAGVRETLDHSYLNEIPGMELPTGEVIARWIWRQLKPALPLLSEIAIGRESVGVRVVYTGEGA